MIEETLHAANWWVDKIIKYNISVEAPSWQSHFEKVMTELLRAKYHNHWYKDDPSRGSGYRAISNEYSLDTILDKAANAVSHSLPENLARMILTSDDRWIVMFVNPGEVVVRDKRFKELVIYDKQHHIYDKHLLHKKLHSLSTDATSNNANSSSSSLTSTARLYVSKSDDDTLSTLQECKSDDQTTHSKLGATSLPSALANPSTGTNPSNSASTVATTTSGEAKSDPEDSNNNNTTPLDTEKPNAVVDYRQLFLQNIHNVARRNKEKEIEAHVQAFKQEMREIHSVHSLKFGPYDEHDTHNHKRKRHTSSSSATSTSVSVSGSGSTSQSQSQSQSQPQVGDEEETTSPSRTNNTTPSGSGSGSKSPSKSSVSHSSPNKTIKGAVDAQVAPDGVVSALCVKEKRNGEDNQILNVLNTLSIGHGRLPNGLAPHVVVPQDTLDHTNYGKDLASILASCEIHAREERERAGQDKGKSGFVVKTRFEYPCLFPMSYASPSPSPSPEEDRVEQEEITPPPGLVMEKRESADGSSVMHNSCSPMYGQSKLRHSAASH